GEGVEADEEQALLYYARCADRGDEVAREAIRQLALVPREESEPPYVLTINIRLSGEGFASEEELEWRDELEELLEREDVGRFVGSGSGQGFMDLVLEVDDVEQAVRQIRRLLREVKLLEETQISLAATE